MTQSTLSIVLPTLFAVLIVCAIVLFGCMCCANPKTLRGWRTYRRDEESSISSSSSEPKPPVGVTVAHEVVSLRDSETSSEAHAEGIQIVEADNPETANVIEVRPDEPPIIEASP